jgi:threonine/homoserine/homoserine lactone efflux protein
VPDAVLSILLSWALMLDARYFAYATISALLVISPGATMAVVMETAMGEGRTAALFTVLGINIGNSTLALSSALGMSVIFHAWPSALQAVKVGGAAYLSYLGLRGLWLAWRGRPLQPARSARPGSSDSGEVGRVPVVRASVDAGGAGLPWPERSRWQPCLVRGIVTNLLNPPVVLFYMTLLPQFIGPRDPFFTRFLVLAATHVGMSLAWLAVYAFALGVLAERFARPAVRRGLEGLTGVLLVGLGARLLLR